MTTPDPPPTFPNPALPRGWRGGVFEGLTPPQDPTWYDEQRHADPIRRALDGDWSAVEELTEAPPPGPTGFDLASVGGSGSGGRPRRLQTLRGVVRRVSATGSGLILEESPDEWLNTSRYHPVDLSGVGSGDLIEAVVELGANGKRYLHRIAQVDDPEGAPR